MELPLPFLVVPAVLAAAAAFAIGWRLGSRDADRRDGSAVGADDEARSGVAAGSAVGPGAEGEELRRRVETLRRVLEVSAELKAHLPLTAVLANVARAAAATFGASRVLLSLRDRADGVLVPRAQVGLADEWPRLSRLRLPAASHAEGSETLPSFLSTVPPAPGEQGPVSVPLTAAEQLVGCLELSGGAGAAADEDSLRLFAAQAVNAIRLARAWETTRLGTRRDPLTGVANHGTFQETLFRELSRHERTAERLVLLLVDLDDFKAVNDRHGHPVGDAVLKAVVSRLVDSVREMDTVARYGGEEFAVVLPQTDPENGLLVAERLRTAVAAAPVPVGLPEPLPLTVSIGLAVYPDDAAAKSALVECADMALYAAKRTGKNRVVRFTKVPSSAEALLARRG